MEGDQPDDDVADHFVNEAGVSLNDFPPACALPVPGLNFFLFLFQQGLAGGEKGQTLLGVARDFPNLAEIDLELVMSAGITHLIWVNLAGI